MGAEELWNWQRGDWPDFAYEAGALAELEGRFMREAGVFIGAVRHVDEGEMARITVDLMSDEALYTSEIEGEVLDRSSLQSSIRRQLGLGGDRRRVPAAEQGVAEMMVDLYRNFAEALTDDVLFRWHGMLMNGRRDVATVGGYRTGKEPMQIVSGSALEPRVHFEAPPARMLRREMGRFRRWFNDSAPSGRKPLPALTRAGLAHWYFVSVHPFEDGNGRIGRALAEKALAQGLGQPTLIALSRVINAKRKLYYDSLEYGNRSNRVDRWLGYFARTVLEAQAAAQGTVDFLIAKTRFFDRLEGRLNARQEKVLLRMFRAGPEGFRGGLSAQNYTSLTGASRATVTRDLQDLVDMGAVSRTGELKSTRYHLRWR